MNKAVRTVDIKNLNTEFNEIYETTLPLGPFDEHTASFT